MGQSQTRYVIIAITLALLVPDAEAGFFRNWRARRQQRFQPRQTAQPQPVAVPPGTHDESQPQPQPGEVAPEQPRLRAEAEEFGPAAPVTAPGDAVFSAEQPTAEQKVPAQFVQHTSPKAETGDSATEKLATYMNADENRIAWRKHWGKTMPQMTAAQLALSFAVLEVGGKSVTGTMDPRICRESDAYSRSDANAGRQQGHAGFSARAARLGGSVGEIEAESWPRPFAGPDELMKHARSCVESWMGSPGHRQGMMNPHRSFCYSMSIGSNGTAYCIGIFGG